MDDADLLRSYSDQRSEDAFAELVGRYVKLVYFTSLRRVRGNTHLAEDVTQIVFTTLARKAPALTKRASIAGWLYVTARLVASEVMRAERRRLKRENKAHLMNELLGNAEPQIEWERLSPVIDEVLDTLTDRDREIVLLRFFHGSQFTDIGATFGLSADAARFRVDRALDRMRRALARRGISSSTAILAVALASQAEATVPASIASTVTGSALASAAGGAASGGGLMGLLGTTKVAFEGWAGVLSLAGILGLTAVGALHELNAAREASAALASANQGYDAQWEHLQALNRTARAADRDRKALLRRLDGSRSAAAGQGSLDAKAEAQEFVAAFPEARAILTVSIRNHIAASCAAFYKSANLTAEQIRQFEDLYVQSSLKLALEISPGQGLLINLNGEEWSAIQGRVSEIFGDQIYPQFQEYMRLMAPMTVVSQIAGAANFAAEPLSAAQVDQLVQIEDLAGSSAPEADDGNPAAAQLKSVLSPAQWKASQAALLRYQLKNAYRDQIFGSAGTARAPSP